MGINVLVVEDEAIIADDLQRILCGLGYEVPTTAASADEALAAAAANRPDLVLMDIKIKGATDGIETARLLRARYGSPIIFLTSYSDEGTLDRAKEALPHGYLLKPFHERELRTAIEVALHRHSLETRLAEREKWLATILQSIGDAVIATDPQENITFINDVAERLTGWTRADAVGKCVTDALRFVDAAGSPIQSPIGRAVAARHTVGLPHDTRLIPKNGNNLMVDDSAAPIVDDAGNVVGGVVIFRDVTQKKRGEARLAQSERLAAIGAMAAGMAHEINNPLAYLIGNVELSVEQLLEARGALEVLLSSGPDQLVVANILARVHDMEDALREASDGAERVRRIVDDLKRFSRAENAATTLLALPSVIDSAVKMTSNAVRRHARLCREYGATPFVEANEGQLTQVLTNLIGNAVEAIGDGDAEQNEIRISTYTDPGGHAVVEVRDTGSGMSKDVMARIFDPFFTTKPVGAGMGLGLAICHNIVTAAGGEIAVESEVGKGTTFKLSFPPAQPISERATSTAPETLAGRRGSILVIDDEPAVARLVERMLRSQHEVTIVKDGRDGLALCAAGQKFDVIFCDVMMPNLTGMDVYRALLATDPEQAKRIVFMTGGAFAPRAQEFLDEVENVFITKPFSAETVRTLARDYVK